MNRVADRNGHAAPRPVEADRLPPQNLDAERGVLGGMLLDNATIPGVREALRPEDFYRASHQVIYRVIAELADAGKEVDAILLTDELKRRGEFDRVGGDEAIDSIIDSIPHAANTLDYAAIVLEKSITRQLIEAENQNLRDAYSGARSADELGAAAAQRILDVVHRPRRREASFAAHLAAGIDLIYQRAAKETAGLPTGFADLDHHLGGFGPGQLVVIGARPGQGKSALAGAIVRHVAGLGRRVYVASLEMTAPEWTSRMLAAESRVPIARIKPNHFPTEHAEALGRAYESLKALDSLIVLDDTPARTMPEIAAAARREKARGGVDLVVLDYLQLVEAAGDVGRNANRQEQVAFVSRRLKALAKDLDAPVLALSQLNRQSTARGNKRPTLSDLRESGQIEQDADVVMLLHRPECYDPDDQPGIAELNVEKNRHGPTPLMHLTFLAELGTFANHARDDF